jgi:hypothetical protein
MLLAPGEPPILFNLARVTAVVGFALAALSAVGALGLSLAERSGEDV